MSSIYDTLSKKGRYGDKELRYVDGELAHVNKLEADLLDNYGLAGEEIVKEMGANTINPETGIKEYFDPISATIVAGGVASVGNLLFNISESRRGKRERERINENLVRQLRGQVQNLSGARALIDEQGELLLERALEQSTLDQEDLFTDFLTESEKITTESEFILGQTNMATSGGLMQALQSKRESSAREFDEDIRRQELESERRVADVLTDTAIAQSNVDAQVAELQTEIARYS
mgnify:CR=1 FL=1|tara:strand:- start:6186 stop:6890 length:705 start_codon:yes stop_codon:yes gene_type:complete